MMKKGYLNQENLYTLILLIFHAIGFVGIVLNPSGFSQYTPFILMLTGFLLFNLHPEKDTLFFLNLFFVFLAAWTLEMIGVSSGLLMGKYKYGEALGAKINHTPVIIGLNWIIVAYSSLQLVHKLAIHLKLKLHEISGALLAALLMVLLDLWIEPLAADLDFWSWNNNSIPIQNYTAWIFFGFAFCFWMLKSGMLKNNPMGWRVYVIQMGFFILLNLFV